MLHFQPHDPSISDLIYMPLPCLISAVAPTSAAALEGSCDAVITVSPEGRGPEGESAE